MANTKRFLVMVDEANRDNLSQMAERLQSIGCQVEETMSSLGIVSVSTDETRLADIQKMQGVMEITSGDEQFYA